VRAPPRASERQRPRSAWRPLRITLLLLILAIAVGQTWLDRIKTTSWQDTLWIGIYPLDGDGSEAAQRYIASLSATSFLDIEEFFAREAHRYHIALDAPVHIELYPAPPRLPPLLAPGSGMLATVWWSLKLRWYAVRSAAASGKPAPHIRVFVLYHDPATSPRVPHSLGLQKGLIGVVYAFAERSAGGTNSIVIAHEVMHTLGATDKYDPQSDAPLYPQGFAEPRREPLYPQAQAEIMAGRLALSAAQFVMPDSLRDVMVGPLTAAEIRWIR